MNNNPTRLFTLDLMAPPQPRLDVISNGAMGLLRTITMTAVTKSLYPSVARQLFLLCNPQPLHANRLNLKIQSARY